MGGRLAFAKAWLWGAGVGGVGLVLAVLAAVYWANLPRTPPGPGPAAAPRQFDRGRRLTAWWDDPPLFVQVTTVPSGQPSNVRPSDYVGPGSCRECHARNYDSWSAHPHRGMNSLATPDTVKGDFSGAAGIAYQGGRANFVREGDRFLMRLERGGVRRTYEVTQTIGGRFWQRYVGKQLEGPEPAGHHFYTKEHVLPFGYWLEQREWGPVVHVGAETTDDQRPDAFDPPEQGGYYAEYSISCNYCHTTFPLGDLFGRFTNRLGEYAPLPLHWSLRSYLEEAHPDVVAPIADLVDQVGRGEALVRNPMGDWEAPKYAVTLGVSCEACHLGCREHVESRGRVLPRFFPTSPHLLVETDGRPPEYGRTHDNVNWACGRCHVGKRPQFAGGMATWNSVEYADAMRGACYSKLRCVDCHNPHQATGRRWSHSPDEDDASCLKCHGQFEPADRRQAHTHHPAGSEGARCMNCHMPRINEGLQDVVRTHAIYSPTRADMIEANHPNACNLCHTDRPIDWTLDRLREWYGKTYDRQKIAANYPRRDEPVGRGWLASDNPAVRLVAVETLARARDARELPRLLDALDDPYLINRQFAYKDLQEMLGVRLHDFGYRYYASSEERRQPLADLRRRQAPPGPGGR
jgi:hypothetical protein